MRINRGESDSPNPDIGADQAVDSPDENASGCDDVIEMEPNDFIEIETLINEKRGRIPVFSLNEIFERESDDRGKDEHLFDMTNLGRNFIIQVPALGVAYAFIYHVDSDIGPYYSAHKVSIARQSREDDKAIQAVQRGRGMTRRGFFAALGGAAVGGMVLGALSLLAGQKVGESMTGNKIPAPNPYLAISGGSRPEHRETLSKKTGFETVLEWSMMHQDPLSRTYEDNILSPYSTSELLLGNKFRYTGGSVNQSSNNERVAFFALIGRRSLNLDRDGKGAEKFDSTTLPDAINTLLDYERLTDEEIKEWIAYTYEVSFRVKFDVSRISITRDPETKKIISAKYDPEPGFNNEMRLAIPVEMDGVAANNPGGKITKTGLITKVVAENDLKNTILLQSGLSPYHDLRVPSKFLPIKRRIEIPLPNGESWATNTDNLAAEIEEYFRIKQSNKRNTMSGVSEEGIFKKHERMAPYTAIGTEEMGRLAQHLLEREPNATQLRQAEIISQFVQSMEYISENGTDFDKPPLATLFDKGGDCNNKVGLWSAMMRGAGIAHAIMVIPAGKKEIAGHVMGGIPKKYFPNGTQGMETYGDYVLVELTSPFPIGQKPCNQEILFMEEIAA